jgi:hypothetical protein
MQIDEREQQRENAKGFIRKSCAPASNATVKRAVQLEKQPLARVRTEPGMKTDESNEQYSNARF